jgi:hypothetical protein
VEAHFCPFGDSINLDATHVMVLLGDEAQVESHFDSFGNSTNLDTR